MSLLKRLVGFISGNKVVTQNQYIEDSNTPTTLELLRKAFKLGECADLQIASAYCRLKLFVVNGIEVQDSDLPRDFRGDKQNKLGILGPCHNAANELRNRGYTCLVSTDDNQSKGE